MRVLLIFTEYYPSTGQIKSITNTSNSGDEVLSYQYDEWGNIDTQGMTRGGVEAIETFDYDVLHRLRYATVNGSETEYRYNPLGNIKYKNDFSMPKEKDDVT